MLMRRKTSPAVKNGIVQKKNRWEYYSPYPPSTPGRPHIERMRPGKHWRHVVRKKDIEQFITLIPEWDTLSRGLHVIMLDSGDDDCMGWCWRNMIGLCAWDRSLAWPECDPQFVEEHRPVLERIGVPIVKHGRRIALDFDEETARAFQLLHIFLHELGHHHDKRTNRSGYSCRGESYAEQWAARYEAEVYDRYLALLDRS